MGESDPETRAMYLAREKAIRDYNASILFAKNEGLKEGMEKGKIDIVKKLITLGISIDHISSASGLTIDEIHEIKKELT